MSGVADLGDGASAFWAAMVLKRDLLLSHRQLLLLVVAYKSCRAPVL
jgi:hypothetical protein